jgi:hypothetical protein
MPERRARASEGALQQASDERQIVVKLCELMDGVKPSYFLKGVYKGKPLNELRNLVRQEFGLDAWPLVEPDMIPRFEDLQRLVDENLIVGVEVKYIKGDRDVRRSFRMVGQPPRLYAFGFDSAVLWHVFSPDVGDDGAKRYASMVGQVVEKLHLPLVYLATKLSCESFSFRFYRPFDVETSYDVISVVGVLRRGCEEVRNPALRDDIVKKFRRALKVVLKIP